jgi:hypothetical protein
MKWIGKRISFVDEKTKTTVVIEPQDIGWIKGAMGAWVCMWLTIGGIVIWYYSMFEFTESEEVATWVFLAFWGYYAVRVTRSWLWLMWGKELIKIDEAKFSYKRSIRRYGKSTPYLLENITKMRMIAPSEKSLQAAWEKSPWIVGGERIEFDYKGKVVRLGRKLDEKDAELLFKFLTKKIGDRVKKMKY